MLRQELARLLQDGVRDPRVGFVTVTEVRPTPDLRTARVYVSIYGTPEEREASLSGLHDARGYLQREVGHRLRLKYVPELSFAADETLDHAARLDAVIGAIHEGAADAPGDAGSTNVAIDTARSDLAARAQAFEPLPVPAPPADARPRRRRPKSPGRRSR